MVYKRRRGTLAVRPTKRRRTFMRKRRRILRRRSSRQIRRKFRVSRGINNFGFPKRKLVRMSWVGVTTKAFTGAGLSYGTSLKVNSPYDPWNGVTGTFNKSAAGFKLYSEIYQVCTVIGAKLVATVRTQKVINLNSAINGTTAFTAAQVELPSFKWGVKLDRDNDISSYTSTGWHAMITDPDCRFTTHVPSVGAGEQSRVVVKYSPKKMFSLRNITDTTQYSCVGQNNPSIIAYAVPWFQTLDESTYQGNVTYDVEYSLRMICLLTEPYDFGLIGATSSSYDVIQN